MFRFQTVYKTIKNKNAISSKREILYDNRISLRVLNDLPELLRM